MPSVAPPLHMDMLTDREPPQPWASGAHKIPWSEPGFSQRMLVQHLDQSHDRASRRRSVIEEQINLLAERIQPKPGSRILDVCCGPGLYAESLRSRGFRVHGVDFSPASIAHATANVSDATFELADVTQTSFNSGYELALLTYGEFNTFPPALARGLLASLREAVFPGGSIVIELQALNAIREQAEQPPDWEALPNGLFLAERHVLLSERFWFDTEQVAVTRYFTIDSTAGVRSYADTQQAYGEHEFIALLHGAGFRRIARFPSLRNDPRYHFYVAGV